MPFFFWAKTNYDSAENDFREAAQTQQQLESSNPYPNSANVQKMRTQLADYRGSLDRLRAELATHTMAAPALPPNEFQTRIQQTAAALADSARLNKVKLPENFKLGFDEYISTLPKTEETPKLARELTQTQLLADLIVEARPDTVTMFRRVAAAPSPGPVPGRLAAPSSLRKVVNQIAAASDQFYIVRTLHIKSQKEKGPAREAATPPPAAPLPTKNPPAAGAAASPSPTSLNFIVGNEHVDLSARVELLNFDGVAAK